MTTYLDSIDAPPDSAIEVAVCWSRFSSGVAPWGAPEVVWYDSEDYSIEQAIEHALLVEFRTINSDESYPSEALGNFLQYGLRDGIKVWWRFQGRSGLANVKLLLGCTLDKLTVVTDGK